MGTLSKLKNIESPLEITRMLEMVGANTELGRPALRFKVALCELDQIADLEEKYPKRHDKTEAGREEMRQFRTEIGEVVVRGWEGVTAETLACVSKRFLQNDGFAQVDDGEIAFDADNRAVALEWMDLNAVAVLQHGCLNTQAFAEERARAKKK